MQAFKVLLRLIVILPLLERLSPFYQLSFHNILLLITSVACFHFSSLCSVFKVHAPVETGYKPSTPLKACIRLHPYLSGGPKWTRTTDLTIISRVL